MTEGCTVVLFEGDCPAWTLVEVSDSAPAAGTSTTTAHFGQRAFLPAYFASTLNFAEQAGQRHTTSDMIKSVVRMSSGSTIASRERGRSAL